MGLKNGPEPGADGEVEIKTLGEAVDPLLISEGQAGGC
jgi:hypothetical protein